MENAPDTRSRWETPAVFILFAALYAGTASRHLLGGDAGEFATIFADGGTAHPPGYPLYSMYLRVFSWLPGETPAHGASLATALLGAGAVAFLYAAARDWGCDRIEATLAILATGLAPHIWLYHTSPEVFALNNAIAAAILWGAAPGRTLKGTARVTILGFLAGLGLSNHLTIVLIAPIGCWGVYRGVAESERSTLTVLAAGAGTLALGLSPYGYLPYVALYETGWHWADPTTLSGVVELFLRRDYGTFQMTAESASAAPLQQLGLLARTVPVDLYVVPLAVGLAGAARFLYAGVQTEWQSRHSYTLALVCSVVLSGPVFACLMTLDQEGVGTVLLRRFHLLPEFQLGLLCGLGAAALRDRRPSRPATILLLAALPLAAIPRIWSTKEAHHAPAVEQYTHDTFQTLPDDAIVLGTGDHNFFGSLYLRRAMNVRRDVTYIDAYLLVHEWYVERRNADLQTDLPHKGETIQTNVILSKLVNTGRPVFVTRVFTDGLLEGWSAVPRGTTIRIYGRADPPPPPAEVYRTNDELYRTFEIAVPTGVRAHSWRRHVLEDYAATWERIADPLRRTGNAALARRAARRASAFRPWESSRHD